MVPYDQKFLAIFPLICKKKNLNNLWAPKKHAYGDGRFLGQDRYRRGSRRCKWERIRLRPVSKFRVPRRRGWETSADDFFFEFFILFYFCCIARSHTSFHLSKLIIFNILDEPSRVDDGSGGDPNNCCRKRRNLLETARKWLPAVAFRQLIAQQVPERKLQKFVLNINKIL